MSKEPKYGTDEYLCTKGNFMLAPTILQCINEDGWYYNKSGDKMYTMVMTDETGATFLVAVCTRIENDENMCYMIAFKNDELISDLLIDYPDLLPVDYPTELDLEKMRPCPMQVISYEPGSVIYQYKDNTYRSAVTEEFDPSDSQWWGVFALTKYLEHENMTRSDLD